MAQSPRTRRVSPRRCSFVAGCATLPEGLDAPKTESTALAQPETTTLGKRFDARAKERPGLSGFRLLVDGADSFALRMRIAEKAERTLDVQYFVLQQDDTGQLLLGALLAAADRGVRVRILLDDALGIDGGAKIRPLAAHPNIEIRVFNPYRRATGARPSCVGSSTCWRSARLDYRMHNKLFVGDNSIAVTGGATSATSISRRARRSSSATSTSRSPGRWCGSYRTVRSFLERSAGDPRRGAAARQAVRRRSRRLPRGPRVAQGEDGVLGVSGLVRQRRSAAGHRCPASSRSCGRKPSLAYDSPDKASTVNGDQPGQLMWSRVAKVAEATKSDLIIVSPYLVPGAPEMELIRQLRERGVRVRILTNSLASTDMPIVHAGYHATGCRCWRWASSCSRCAAHLGEPETNRGTIRSGSSGAFALHAKVFVIDRERAFVGSMNFDQRSLRINTELGLIIDSPQSRVKSPGASTRSRSRRTAIRLILESADAAAGPSLRWVGVKAATRSASTPSRVSSH